MPGGQRQEPVDWELRDITPDGTKVYADGPLRVERPAGFDLSALRAAIGELAASPLTQPPRDVAPGHE